MSVQNPGENVAKSLRPVVIVVVAAKMTIMAFLFANVAGLVPSPATAEHAAVYTAQPAR